MSLTTGRGPLSANPAGRFSPAVPHPVVYVEPYRRRVRGVVGDREVIDSERVLLVHRPGHPPTYAFPAEDVHRVPTESEPEATDLLVVSSTTTYCPYKGAATYWTAVVGDEAVEDVAWSYGSPVAEAVPIRGMLCFEAARTTMVADLPA